MRWLTGWLVVGFLLASSVIATGQEPRKLAYELKTVTRTTIAQPAGGQQKLQSEVTVRYAWHVRGREMLLVLESLAERNSVDDVVVSRSVTTRDAIRTEVNGTPTVLEFRNAAAPVQQVLSETYGVPLIQRIEESTTEAAHKVVAKGGAEETLQKGYLAPALFLQASYPGEKTTEWESPGELGFGNIGLASGTVRYKAGAMSNETIRVAVGGTLKNQEGKIDPRAGHRLYGVEYGITGEQVYSPAKQQWISARLNVATQWLVTRDDRNASRVRGTMTIELKSR